VRRSASGHSHSCNVMKEEVLALGPACMYELVGLPQERETVDCKRVCMWVLKVELAARVKIEHNEAWLVTNGL
jgi:hypothetical protein